MTALTSSLGTVSLFLLCLGPVSTSASSPVPHSPSPVTSPSFFSPFYFPSSLASDLSQLPLTHTGPKREIFSKCFLKGCFVTQLADDTPPPPPPLPPPLLTFAPDLSDAWCQRVAADASGSSVCGFVCLCVVPVVSLQHGGIPVQAKPWRNWRQCQFYLDGGVSQSSIAIICYYRY